MGVLAPSLDRPERVAGLDSEMWYDRFSRLAGDLYPQRYTRAFVRELVAMARHVLDLAQRKDSTIVAHNYQFPELQEVAEMVGDSLGLSQYLARRRQEGTGTRRVDFLGVQFMGETAKTILGDDARVFMPGLPGCSLVASIEQARLDRWRAAHPDGVVVAYVNTDVLTKSKSDYVCTSRNAGEVMRHAARANPGRRILFLPDKFLGAVAVSQAQADPDLQDLAQRVDLYDGACHVHARIGERALDEACDRYPDADLLIHPECGCASSCLARTLRGDLRHRHAYFFSTEQMLWHARTSPVREFIVATEAGMVYRLRREIPGKVFWPVSYQAVCEYMKMNTLDKLRESLEHDRVEIRIDPAIREGARAAIDRMLSIQ